MNSSWKIISDKRRICSKWRNIVVEGPGVVKPRRKFWLAWNTQRREFKRNQCLVDMKIRHPEKLIQLAKEMRETKPAEVW